MPIVAVKLARYGSWLNEIGISKDYYLHTKSIANQSITILALIQVVFVIVAQPLVNYVELYPKLNAN